MRSRIHSFVPVVLACLLLLSACSAAEPQKESEEQPEVSREEQLAALRDVDTSVKPDGPNVDELFTIEEAAATCELEDVFIAVPAG